MGRLKFAELIILTISALVTAAKFIIRFIEYIGKIIKQPATT